MKKSEFLLTQILENQILQVTLHRPQRKNALNTALLVDLSEILEQAVEQKIRAVVIHGSEKNFAAGADVDEIAELNAQEALLDKRVAAWQKIRQCPIPLIAAVEGYCLGGGLELVLSCDFALAETSAKFGLPEVTLGIMPGAGGTQILPRVLGRSRAAAMIYTGKIFPAEKMWQWGLLVDLVEENVLAEALQYAKRIAQNAPFAIRQAKQSLLLSEELGLEDGLKFERQAFSLLSATQDKHEGISAFKNKRSAEFKGS